MERFEVTPQGLQMHSLYAHPPPHPLGSLSALSPVRDLPAASTIFPLHSKPALCEQEQVAGELTPSLEGTGGLGEKEVPLVCSTLLGERTKRGPGCSITGW